MGGSKRLVLVPSLSAFPTNTCDRETGSQLTACGERRQQCNAALRPHVVASLALRPVHRVRPAVQAGRHLERLDELGRPDATGALRHDPGEAHFSPQVDLKTP